VALSAAAAQALALLATGSRGAVLGLALGAVAWAFVRWSGRAVAALVVVLAFGGAAIAVSPARPLETTIAGRVYLWRVVAPHATQRWVSGLGPGVFELQFPRWQREAAARGQRDLRFLGLTDHAHNDYLEALVERGVPGLLALLAALGWAWRAARARPRPVAPVVAAALATVVAGAACALVDFPLARPVELTWWWLAVAVILSAPSRFLSDTAS
jgi:O-antigen ligase